MALSASLAASTKIIMYFNALILIVNSPAILIQIGIVNIQEMWVSCKRKTFGD
jgi:hypothetical protein